MAHPAQYSIILVLTMCSCDFDDEAWEVADMNYHLSVQVMIWKNSDAMVTIITSFEQAKLLAADTINYHTEPLPEELNMLIQWNAMTLTQAEKYVSDAWAYYHQLANQNALKNEFLIIICVFF